MAQALNRIADDIYQLQVPLPFALNIVNCYLLRGSQGWTIVDCGINTPAGREIWQDAFTALKMRPRDIEKIVLTHVHPDHFGLSGWLQALALADGRAVNVYTSPREDQQATWVWRAETINFERWLLKNGMPPAMARDVDHSMGDTHTMTLPHPAQMLHIEPNTMVTLGDRQFRTIHAPGHSDGQMLFYDADDRLILSGDHVLMKITPNIGLWEHTDPNPLGAFLQSLTQLQTLDVRLALSGHKKLVEDWAGRIGELIGHHHERLDHTREALASGANTPYDVTMHIFKPERFTAHEWRFAIAESLAHLDYLQTSGEVVFEILR